MYININDKDTVTRIHFFQLPQVNRLVCMCWWSVTKPSVSGTDLWGSNSDSSIRRTDYFTVLCWRCFTRTFYSQRYVIRPSDVQDVDGYLCRTRFFREGEKQQECGGRCRRVAGKRSGHLRECRLHQSPSPSVSTTSRRWERIDGTCVLSTLITERNVSSNRRYSRLLQWDHHTFLCLLSVWRLKRLFAGYTNRKHGFRPV